MLWFFIAVGLSIITVLGDGLIKYASQHKGFSAWGWLVFGSLIYGFTGFGWFFVMREKKLLNIGIIYSISTVVFLILVSIFYFKEKITLLEMIGIVFAILSIFILSRFA